MNELTFLFWNFRCDDPDREAIAARVALEHRVDVMVLAESTVDADRLLGELNRSEAVYEWPDGHHDRFKVFTRFPGRHLEEFLDEDRISVRRLVLPRRKEVLFAMIHFFDRRHHDRDAQHSKSRSVFLTIRDAEEKRHHARTIIVGDFNMNPFEKGMIDPEVGFGAMMNRDLAARHSSGEPARSRRFYNPMWSKLGRNLPEPPGTHYWGNVGDPFNVYWHSLDQILIRPDLFDAFRDEDFHILTSIPSTGGGRLDLVRSTGKHWEIQISDHLPILFKLHPPMEDNHA